jgi:hypothetical protein
MHPGVSNDCGGGRSYGKSKIWWLGLCAEMTHSAFYSLVSSFMFFQCFHFNIPQDDDANIVFVALPDVTDDTDAKGSEWTEKTIKIEDYYIEQTFQLSKLREEGTNLPRKYPNAPPQDVENIMKELIDLNEGNHKVGCKVVLSNPQSGVSRSMESFYFTPIVINNVQNTIRNQNEEWEPPPLEGYSICFNNEENELFQVQMIMEVVMVSDTSVFDGEGKGDFNPTHLTPLGHKLSESVSLANSVLREMEYMNKRETRMRNTADSINGRVRYFFYISVSVLLAVTFGQVSYLKRYFHKKKLM